MKHEGPEFDDYTSENVSGATIFGGGLILIFIAMAIFFAIKSRPEPDIYIDKKSHIVIDRETKSISEREPLNHE